MTTTISSPSLHAGRGTTHGALTVFPVWVEGRSMPPVDWRPAALRVDERDGSPVVEELVVRNTSNAASVLLEGDVLEGGWQNRMAVDDLLLAPGAASVVSVRCVEQHRWRGDGGHRAAGRRSPYGVRFGLLMDAMGRPDQRQVWSRVERFERELGVTKTSSLVEHLMRRPAPRFERVQGQRGVIIGIAGRVVAAEVFGSRTGFLHRRHAITDAAWLDAQSALAAGMPAVPTPGWAARDFASALGRMPLEDGGAAGTGLRVASAPGSIVARGLGLRTKHDGTASVVHLTAVDVAHPVLTLD